MKTIQFISITIIASLILCSCEKEKQQESILPETYFDYDDFVKDGLIAYYPFNGNTDDFSNNNLNGIGENLSYSTDRFGKENGACKFDGKTSYIKIDNSSLLNSNTYTVCFWYRADMADTLYQAILSKSDSARFGYTIEIYNKDHYSNLAFIYRDKATESLSWQSFGPWFREGNFGPNQKYEFAAISFSERDFIDYLGGREVTEDPGKSYNTNQFELYIGKSNSGKYKNYSGEIDDLLIYNRILTYDEIQKLYDYYLQED